MYLIVSWCYESKRLKFFSASHIVVVFQWRYYGTQFCILSSSKTHYSLKWISNVHLLYLLCHSCDGRLGGNESCVSVVLEVTWRVVEARAWFGGWPYVSLERQTALPFLQHFDRQVGVQPISSQTKVVSSTSCFEVFPQELSCCQPELRGSQARVTGLAGFILLLTAVSPVCSDWLTWHLW